MSKKKKPNFWGFIVRSVVSGLNFWGFEVLGQGEKEVGRIKGKNRD